MDKECTLDTHILGNSSYSEGCPRSATTLPNYDTFKDLNTLAISFGDSRANLDGIARPKLLYLRVRYDVYKFVGFHDRVLLLSEIQTFYPYILALTKTALQGSDAVYFTELVADLPADSISDASPWGRSSKEYTSFLIVADC